MRYLLLLLLFTAPVFGLEPVQVPDPTPEAIRFYQTGNILWIVNQAWELFIPLLILFTGFSAKIRNVARAIGRKWFFEIIIYFFLFFILVEIVNYPLAYYSSFVRLKEYGLSMQTFNEWFVNFLKTGAVNMVIGIVIIWIPYLLIKKSPRRWWFYTWLLSIPIVLFFQFVTPIWIDPIFNHYGPMKDKQLEQQILSLADCAGIEDSRVFEVDKSQDTTLINAYVTGFGNTKRIVLWDTIIQAMTPKELLFVMGHEMGHYVLHHVWYSLAYFIALYFFGLYFIHRLAHFFIRKFSSKFQFSQLGDIASLPLILFLLGVYNLVTMPLSNYVSRTMEHEADRFGLEITHDNHAAANSFVKLQSENLGYPYPGPLFVLWRSSHPPIGERIEFFNTYHPWDEGKPSKYQHEFKRCYNN